MNVQPPDAVPRSAPCLAVPCSPSRPAPPDPVPVLSADEAIAVAHDVAADLAAASSERDRDRVLPEREVDRLSASGLLAITVPASTAAPTCPSRCWSRSSGSSPPATRASPRCRTATSSTSTRCATRARPSSSASSSARCWPASGSATPSPRSAPATSATSVPSLTPAGQGRWILNGTKGYSTGALFAALDPGARAPGHARRAGRRPAARRLGRAPRPRRDGHRRLERHGPAHDRQRHGRPASTWSSTTTASRPTT